MLPTRNALYIWRHTYVKSKMIGKDILCKLLESWKEGNFVMIKMSILQEDIKNLKCVGTL